MRVVGIYNWHDGGYAVMEDGKIVEHIEFERYTRIKESGGDSLQYFKDCFLSKHNLSLSDVDYWVSPCPSYNLKDSDITFDVDYYSHHLCHAAHAYYSSPFDDAHIFTIDAEGMEDDGRAISTGVYNANGLKITKIGDIDKNQFSLGTLWGRAARMIFKLSSGYPRGSQAGTVMAMAALGDPSKYYDDFRRMATEDYSKVAFQPEGYVKGRYVPPEEDVIHPYLNKYRLIAEDEAERYNLAASLQKVTEDCIYEIMSQVIGTSEQISGNVCLAGGVSLNSLSTGKIKSWFGDNVDNIFIPPVPGDGGHAIGACQYYWHHVLENKKINEFFSPYLGENYLSSDIEDALLKREDELEITRNVSLDACADLLVDNKIVAVFQGRSESGKRALGNRSILANPISPEMKEMINEKVKHRQSFRLFAPSVLEEHAGEWFEGFFPSPYMAFVFPFRKSMLGKVPAVEHFDGTARVQSVNKNQNPIYYELILSFYERTGVPILLNTSFNDREPICETPDDSINCFLGTEIDFLYFVDENILVRKRDNENN